MFVALAYFKLPASLAKATFAWKTTLVSTGLQTKSRTIVDVKTFFIVLCYFYCIETIFEKITAKMVRVHIWRTSKIDSTTFSLSLGDTRYE